MISTVSLCYRSYRDNDKSSYTAVHHHDIKGTLSQSLVAVLYIPLTHSINNYSLHLKNHLWHIIYQDKIAFIVDSYQY